MHQKTNSHPHVSLAFSGGGYRAAAFSLGVLAFLIDKKLISTVKTITSVSGGSLLNVFIDQQVNIDDIGIKKGHEIVNDFAYRLANKSVYFAEPLVTTFTISFIVAITTIFISLFSLVTSNIGYLHLQKPAIYGLGSGVVIMFGLLSIRNLIFIKAFQKVFGVGGSWRGGRLPVNAERTCQHVICATDLVRGEPVFFSHEGVRSLTLGNGAGIVDPAHAMAFSAAFPGLMKPFVVKVENLFLGREKYAGERIILVDGGVINNLGTQWWEPASGGTTRAFGSREITIVVDASTALHRWSPVKYIPSTLSAASRVFTLIYSNSVRPRLEYIRRNSSAGHTTAIGISLSEDPCRVLHANMGRDLGGKSSELENKLNGKIRNLTEISARVQNISTGLRALGNDAVRDLVTHGYYLAMIELAGASITQHDNDGISLDQWFQPNPMKIQ